VGNFFDHAILHLMRLAVLALVACTAGQARTAHRAGEVAAAAGIIGIIGTVGVAEAVPGHDTTILHVGIVFIPVTVLGALLYVATDSTVNQSAPPEVSEDRTRDTAMALAKQAKHAARRGDCAEVLALEPRVRELDAGIYRRFRNDVVIKTCLPAEPAGSDTAPLPGLPANADAPVSSDPD
jgi:hypothetical protein